MERAPSQTLFLNRRSRGKVFCEIDRLWADTEFFNKISPERTQATSAEGRIDLAKDHQHCYKSQKAKMVNLQV